MAEITNESFKELINATKETNDLLREDMISESKPDPVRFMKEEAANILIAESNRRASKELLGVEKKESQDLLKTEKKEKAEQEEKKKHELEWFKEQERTTKEVSALANLYNVRSAATMGLIIAGPDDDSGAAEAEAADEEANRDSKMLGYLKSTAGFLGGIAKQGYEKVKSGLSGFKKFAFGALALAALSFLNDPRFTVIKNTILDLIIPALAYLYDEIIKPLALYIGGKLKKLFKDLKAYIDGEKGIGAVLWENIGTVSAIVLALAVKTLGFGALLTGVKGIGKALLWTSKKTGLTALIKAELVAIKLAFAQGFLVGMKALLVPLAATVAIIAGIALVIYSLKQAFDDFMFELEATGSIWEATKTGIVSVISNILGLPFDLLKDGVSYIIGKIGDIFGIESFVNASKSMDEFSFVDMFKEGLTWIGDWFEGMFDSMKQLAQAVLKKIPGGETLSNWIFGTKEEQEAEKKRKEEEQKLFEENRKALREKQKLEKDAGEAKELAIKKKEHELMIQKSAPAAAKLNTIVGAAYVSTPPQIINAPTTSVSSSPTTNVTQNRRSLAPLDKVIDILTVSA